MRRMIMAVLAVIISLVLVITGCGAADEGAVGEGDGEVTIGIRLFKDTYPESPAVEHIIGQLMKQVLEERGFKVNLVEDLTTEALWEGMAAGDIDISADYTGAAWIDHLGHEYEQGVDNNQLYQMVKEEEAGQGFIWLDAIWNNRTFVAVSWPEFVEEHDLESLSDLAALYQAEELRVRTIMKHVFVYVPYGLPAFAEVYGIETPNAKGFIKAGRFDNPWLPMERHMGDVMMGAFGTDAAIAKNNWYIYLDDKGIFPPNDLTPYVRKDVLDKHPAIADILNELVATFPGGGQPATPAIVAQTQKVWQALNLRVDYDELAPAEVAREYLVEHGLVK